MKIHAAPQALSTSSFGQFCDRIQQAPSPVITGSSRRRPAVLEAGPGSDSALNPVHLKGCR
ncbi:MAG TPA: hypothetical protein VFI20_03485 [Terracidiphilus sp.]|nr:hypothetical protein [Terracidiphilus sp.]